jgi:integrase
MGLGGFPEVSLKEAREKAREKRDMVREGRDPVAERHSAKRALLVAQATHITFAQAARQCHEMKSSEFRNDKHAAQWINTLETYAFPVLGPLAVDEIETAHVYKVLEPIWKTKTETARRLRQRIEAVIRWAYTKKKIKRDNPASWEGNLQELLPKPSKVQKKQHFKALPVRDIGAFLVELRKRHGQGARALEFSILTASRSGEVRGMTWDEVDIDRSLWVIPGERMKSGKEHRVPLSKAALKVLGEPGEGLVFPAPRGGMVSDMTLSKVLRSMDIDAVPHGFRSTFKDWAREYTRYPDEVSEPALAHVNSDATRAAYARSELIEQRRKLMDDWARFCSKISEAGKVVPIRKTKKN